MKTRITELFGIECRSFADKWWPHQALCSHLNAGGLGNITCNYDTGEELRQAIHQARELTSKPIGINILLPSMRYGRNCGDFFKVCAEES